jgi:hypothetical protein
MQFNFNNPPSELLKEKYFYELIRAGFLKETPFRDEDIHYVFTKDGMKPKDSTIKSIIEEVLIPKQELKGGKSRKRMTQKPKSKQSKKTGNNAKPVSKSPPPKKYVLK